jgi:hypothetical protein
VSSTGYWLSSIQTLLLLKLWSVNFTQNAERDVEKFGASWVDTLNLADDAAAATLSMLSPSEGSSSTSNARPSGYSARSLVKNTTRRSAELVDDRASDCAKQ